MQVDNYDFSKIENLPDYNKRVNLIKSWQGQIGRCQKKGEKDPYFFELAESWQKKIDLCLAGAPLEECQGKVKVKGRKPFTKKQRLRYMKEKKQAKHEEYLRQQKERMQKNG